jgi:site-specific DNA recombinase
LYQKGSDYLRKISKIETQLPQLPEQKKVAAYARVSEEKGRTLHSMSAQVSFYSSYIQKNRQWQYAGVYADEGISGTTDNRTEFRRMLEDCEKGNIDIILTKSISRFARNTVDLLETVRHLKDLGVEVRFEKEDINSLSEDGELMLTLLASFAQEESRSTSENIKWAIRKKFQQGRPNSFNVYGYRWNGEQFIVEPEEAKIVRLIFDNFLNGLSAEQTEVQLEEMGVKSYTGGHFSNTSIRTILRNEKYTGNMLLQKVFIPDHITHKSKNNEGELPQYWVENSHEAIISLETYEKVQDEIARRRELGALANPAINTGCFTSKIKCGICGRSFQRSSRSRKRDNSYKMWICATRKKGHTCNNKDIPETTLEKVCAEVLEIEEFDETLFSEQIEKILVPAPHQLIFHFRDGGVVNRRWESTARKDWWTPEARAAKSAYNKKHPRSSGAITCFTCKISCSKCGQNLRRNTSTRVSGEKARHWRCPPHNDCGHSGLEENLLKSISADVLGIDEFDEAVFTDKVDRITVISNEELAFHLKDGSEITQQWQFKRRQPAWSEERKQRQSEKMIQVWREKHEQSAKS